MMALLLLLLALLSPLLALLLFGLLVVIVRLRADVRRLDAEARHDPLTGLANRRGLEAQWASLDAPPALVFIDLEGFKTVNDTHGHIVGDALLRQVALRLAAAVAPGGKVARWGGDEFVALLPPDQLELGLRRIADAKTLPYDLSETGGPLSVRVAATTGVVTGEPDLARAVRAADTRLLAARRTTD